MKLGSAHRPEVVVVGGFLGAGKTTLLIAAAKKLKAAGLKVGLVFNDQSADLVDTAWAGSQGADSREVAGGCFCCRLSDFIEAAASLSEMDVIFAEPVGSCTDLSATVLHPLQRDFVERFKVAPLTVLVDPASVETLRADPDTQFLFENQIAEADLVCFTKSDKKESIPDLPGVPVRRLSAVSGEGVDAWLDEVLSGTIAAGQHTLDIDYERYAAAEAALGWLNCKFTLSPQQPQTPSMVIGPLLDRVVSMLTQAGIQIAHLKVLDRASSGYLKASVTGNTQDPQVEGDLSASAAPHHEVILNLRAAASPEFLRHSVEQSLPAGAEMKSFAAFRPSPNPNHESVAFDR